MGKDIAREVRMDGQPEPFEPDFDKGFPTLKLFDRDVTSYSTLDIYRFLCQVKNILGKLLPDEKDRKVFWDHILMADDFFCEMRNLPFTDKAEMDEWFGTMRISTLPEATVRTQIAQRAQSPASETPDQSA